MVFSSPFFVSIVFPALLFIYFIAGIRFRNALLLLFSILFYTWGDPKALPIMILVILLNFWGALFLYKSKNSSVWFTAIIITNVIILGVFKYSDFIINNINYILNYVDIPTLPLPEMALPIGISFYVFQAISYICDVYWHRVAPQNSLPTFALYISLFPQLIAGPIVRYLSIARDLNKRWLIYENIQNGLIRFCIGLAKKVLIADNMGFVADCIFDSPTGQIPCFWAWTGAIVYALQIYYDFSAYSDMAIGIGRIFNFNFPENFNYPYSARTLQEFWRRWHMSLTTWLRDYLYIPLGGSKGTLANTRRNILIVLLCCGIWHGAAWNFLIWGLYNGIGLIGERIVFKSPNGKAPGKFTEWSHALFTLLFILVGWVIFRCDSFAQIASYLKIMFIGNPSYSIYSLETVWNNCVTFSNMLYLLVAIIFCFKLPGVSFEFIGRSVVSQFVILLLFIITYSFVMTSSYSPFLYFRF